jgi:hypothetical protein
MSNVMTQPDVWVFKTNILNKRDSKKITPLMDAETRIKSWSVDHEDSAKVLRVESHQIQPSEIIDLIKKAGYACEELTD